METIFNLIKIAVYIACLVYIAILLTPDVKKALAIGNKELNYFKKVYLKAIDNNEKKHRFLVDNQKENGGYFY